MTTRKPRPTQNSPIKDGQECVWDYPRPPALEPVKEAIRINFGGQTIAATTAALRVLETSHPPTVYIPTADIAVDVLRTADRQTFCEWKGVANYFHVVTESATAEFAAWYYPKPNRKFAELERHVAFYPSRMSECYWGDELVRAQPGDFYGGWITSKIVGPFKGDAGTGHW